ncbi:MAG: sensor histidine kinase [Candidatus Promineifilaceae bacterium]|jgi:signal transduction histidine kinase
MSELRSLLDINYELIIFAYGLVFFVLGLAIALQPRQRSRLSLAQSLGWLSIFGIIHGLHEWGYLFIPIQATYMNHAGAALPQVFQTLLLGISFFALFQFGVDLYRDRWPRLWYLPTLVFLLWLGWLFYSGLFGGFGVGLWQQYASIWARYFLAVPAALLAAFGIRQVAQQQIRPLGLSSINNMLVVASIAFAAYAFFAGIIVPAADFFPANWLNQSHLAETVGIPVELFRSLIGLVLAITMIRAMQVFDVEIDHMIEAMEAEQTLAAERERLGRELHDGAIQMVYSAGLIVESARAKVDDGSVVGDRLDNALLTINEAINSLRATMVELRSQEDDVSLLDGLQQQAVDPRMSTLLDVTIDNELPAAATLDRTQTRHVLAITAEALSNVVRHAQATRANIVVGSEDGQFVLLIQDNGVGFDQLANGSGYGLRNMQDRARLLGGELEIKENSDGGTAVKLAFPMETI